MLDKTYQPTNFENKIYRQWEKAGTFSPQQTKTGNKPFVVVLPPPNANADLHLGHALDLQFKDILARWHRLKGHYTLLLPGADHAGFETWSVYEKHLNARGKSRFDFEREELYKQVYEFVLNNKSNMENQIRRLGISCDWQRFTFTLDDKIVSQAYATFKQMCQRDLIYRGKRPVNYCVQHGTGFSDFEVTHQEVAGKLWFIKYPLEGDERTSITIATTRPETMLGDVAVAVHPQDGRYAKLQGKLVKLPLSNRLIPVIADERVASDFGTGAVKITPAHDFLDFEIAQDADLQPMEIINKKGCLTDKVPAEFIGLSVQKAREEVVTKLKAEGYLEKVLDYSHQVGHCYKCETILEPLLIDQWFVRIKPLAEAVIERLENNEVKFYPESKGQELITHLKQLKDWNISRQIAWGIPIPIFQNEANKGDWVFDERVDQAKITVDGQTYRRDPDVFDTWWSSGHWAFATVDWANDKRLYPQALMETGVDILRPWVARMMLLSLFVTNEMPFKTVYLHGMVVDEKGAKMSKSKGNVVNPMDVIKEFGADALRISLCGRITAGQPQRITEGKTTPGRNFCNKLWNIGRFVQGTCGQGAKGKLSLNEKISLNSSADHWVWNQFLKSRQEMGHALDNYQLTNAWNCCFNFVWNDFADWYLEICKWQLNKPLLSYLFINTLRLAHPFAPFITETLYQEMVEDENQPMLINNIWPDDELQAQPEAVLGFEQIQASVARIRQLLPLDLRRQAQLVVKNQELIKDGLNELYCQLTAIPKISITDEVKPIGLPINQQPGQEFWIILDAQLLQQQLVKLETEAQTHKQIGLNLQKRLANEAYLKKAPQYLVEESKQQLQDLKTKIYDLESVIADFKRAI